MSIESIKDLTKESDITQPMKYVAIAAMVLMCAYQAWALDGNRVSASKNNALSPVTTKETGTAQVRNTWRTRRAKTRARQLKAIEDFQHMLKMPLQEKFRYFLERQDVKEQLHRGDMCAVVIPLQLPGDLELGWKKGFNEQENLLLIRAKGDLKNGADVVNALCKSVPFTVFSPYEKYCKGTNDNWICEVNYGWTNREDAKKTIKCIKELHDISDLIVSSEEPEYRILGVCFVNAYEQSYLGVSSLPDDEMPRRIVSPKGTLMYKLTWEEYRSEEYRKMKKERRPRFGFEFCHHNERVIKCVRRETATYRRVLAMPLQEQARFFLEREDELLQREKWQALVIPLQSPELGKEQENLLLIRTNGDWKTGTDVAKALKAQSLTKIAFCSPFDKINWVYDGDSHNDEYREKRWRLTFDFAGRHIFDLGKDNLIFKKIIQCIQEHGDISDLIVSSEDPDHPVLGISFFVVRSRPEVKEYRDVTNTNSLIVDDNLPILRRVVLPQGTAVYGLAEEVFCKKLEKAKVEWTHVLEKPIREKFRYFLEMEDVKEQLYRENRRAVVIPLQSPELRKEQENLLLICVEGDVKKGADVMKNSHQNRGKGLSRKYSSPFALFAPFEKHILYETDGDNADTNRYWKVTGIRRLAPVAGVERTIQCIVEREDISDLIVSSAVPGRLILGVYFVNVYGSKTCVGEKDAYKGSLVAGDRFPRRVVSPQGAVMYELTEEMVRKQLEEEERIRWENRDKGRMFNDDDF